MIRIITLLFGCLTFSLTAQTPAQRFTFQHPQMGTVFNVVFFANMDSVAARAVAAKVFARIDTLNAIYSDYLPESELSRLSDKAGSGEKVKVSPEMWDILRLANQYSRASNGCFDVTVGAVTRLWRKARNMKELPDTSRITAARATVGYASIQFYKGHRVRLGKKGTRLDLGGIAQGYAADDCLQLLKKAGISRALVDAGGDIALGDPPPGTTGWTIERATGNDGPEKTVVMTLSNCGITTSGAQYRFFESGGVRYSHIVDPRTGWGMTHRHLVTVQAPNAVTADAWATALSVMSEKEWLTLRRKHKDLKVWIAQLPL